ncbi:hypothetical protein K3495_g5108 [Podosphaera aphanis]|nr:hypothetical protein K3495_g5108 [Podosphaera aphanis]
METSEPVTRPAFLQNLSSKDKAILALSDSDVAALSWQQVCELAKSNQLDRFSRRPSELRRYLEHNAQLSQRHGSILAYILSQQLGWREGERPSGGPFEQASDWKVLLNNWPYELEPDIVHLVVWTKFSLDEDEDTGDLTWEAKVTVQRFVDATFGSQVGEENVVWFRNWRSLKSIRGVEHIHVMLHKPDPNFVREITATNPLPYLVSPHPGSS